MQPSRQHCLLAFCCLVALSALATPACADVLTITSSPSGANVEIDGQPVGPTPYKIDYPGGYFHKTHSVFGERLEHSMLLRVSKDGYLSQQVTITTGPFEWVGLTGRHHGTYFLLRSDTFKIRLDPVSTRGEFSDTSSGAGPIPAYNGKRDNDRSVAGSEGILNNSHQVDGSQANSGALTITSDLIGEDIFIDGKFAGQTPSTIHLSAGSHHVEVKSPGKKPLIRDLEVTAGSELTLHAVSEAAP
jgi:hypothetical protein